MSAAAVGGAERRELPLSGRIGPNAIIRAIEALDTLHGRGVRRAVLAAAGLLALDEDGPREMVDEASVVALHRAAQGLLGGTAHERIAEDAGRRTAIYLVEHRIPGPARAILPRLPRRIAATILMKAIGGHAWTFAGSGSFAWRLDDGRAVTVHLRGGPFATTATAALLAPYYAATFTGLFERLLRARCVVAVETGRGLDLAFGWQAA